MDNATVYDFGKIMHDYHNGTKKEKEKATLLAVDSLDGLINKMISTTYRTYAAAHYEDLHSCGVMGILDGLRTYDPTIVLPSTFFYPRIKHELQKYIDINVAKTTPYYSAVITKLRKAIAIIENDMPNYTAIDLAEYTKLPVETVSKALQIIKASDTINLESCTDATLNETNLLSMSPEDECLANELTACVHNALKNLDNTEIKIITLIYGFSTDKPASVCEIAKELGLSLDTVKKIHNCALRKLRNTELQYHINNPFTNDEHKLAQTIIPLIRHATTLNPDMLADIATIKYL